MEQQQADSDGHIKRIALLRLCLFTFYNKHLESQTTFWTVLIPAVDVLCSARPLAPSVLPFSLASFKPRYSLYSSAIETHRASCVILILYSRDGLLVLKMINSTHFLSPLELGQCPPGNESHMLLNKRKLTNNNGLCSSMWHVLWNRTTTKPK